MAEPPVSPRKGFVLLVPSDPAVAVAAARKPLEDEEEEEEEASLTALKGSLKPANPTGPTEVVLVLVLEVVILEEVADKNPDPDPEVLPLVNGLIFANAAKPVEAAEAVAEVAEVAEAAEADDEVTEGGTAGFILAKGLSAFIPLLPLVFITARAISAKGLAFDSTQAKQ